jgi:NCS1 family nucleobase:cation symporter-1
MHILRRYMYPSIVITTITIFGMLGWALKQNGGLGPVISSPIQLTSTQYAFLFLQCTSSTAATWSGTGDRFADWTRFARNKRSAQIVSLTALPIFMTLMAAIGAIITSAFYQTYGTALWSPLDMLIYVQGVQYTPACRAGTFFAGIGLLSSQLYSNITQNTVGFAIDWVGIMPR